MSDGTEPHWDDSLVIPHAGNTAFTRGAAVGAPDGDRSVHRASASTHPSQERPQEVNCSPGPAGHTASMMGATVRNDGGRSVHRASGPTHPSEDKSYKRTVAHPAPLATPHQLWALLSRLMAAELSIRTSLKIKKTSASHVLMRQPLPLLMLLAHCVFMLPAGLRLKLFAHCLLLPPTLASSSVSHCPSSRSLRIVSSCSGAPHVASPQAHWAMPLPASGGPPPAPGAASQTLCALPPFASDWLAPAAGPPLVTSAGRPSGETST